MCLKTYSTPYNLKTHIKTFHYDITQFQCEICLQNFKHKCSLEKHFLKSGHSGSLIKNYAANEDYNSVSDSLCKNNESMTTGKFDLIEDDNSNEKVFDSIDCNFVNEDLQKFSSFNTDKIYDDLFFDQISGEN